MMRLFILPVVATALCAALATTPAAQAQVADWDFVLQSSGDDVSWTSPSAIDPSYAGYEYTYRLTVLEADIGLLGWQSLLGEIDEEDRTGGGALGSLPQTFINESVVDNDVTGSALTAIVGINGDGYGYATLSDITLGSLLGQEITGVRIAGEITIIPEPASLALLGVGALMLVKRRGRRGTAIA